MFVTAGGSEARISVLGRISGELCARDLGEFNPGAGGNGLFKSVTSLGYDDVGCLLIGVDNIGSIEVGELGWLPFPVLVPRLRGTGGANLSGLDLGDNWNCRSSSDGDISWDVLGVSRRRSV